jgi:nicotinamide mononucleotide transporter
MEILEKINQAVLNTSIWEWFAVVTGLLYVILISYKKISAWFFAIVSSILYIYLCYSSQLFLETGLQFFYLIMAVYGWYMWNSEEKKDENKIIQWKNYQHSINIAISTILFITIGFLFDVYTKQANPYTDAFTTVFSLAATFMVTQKVLENWIYWIVIDAVSVYLFSSRELYMTAVLFVIFTILAIVGYFKWKTFFDRQTI